MYGSNSRVLEENLLYGLLGASEPYILEYVKGNPVELKGMHTGTAKSEITEFKIFGWSQQTKTNGYQVFDKTKAEDNKYQQYNISENQLSIITASNFWITGFIEVEQNTSYTINVDSFAGVYYDENNQSILNDVIYNGRTFITPQGCKYIVLTFDKKLVPYTARNSIMLNKGTVQRSYEKYSGGVASPSAKYPQAIQGVGTNEKVVINVGGQEAEIEVKLYGIQNDEEPTYIDEFGQGWIADELNLLTGKVIRRVSAEDETKEVQILEEPVEENINVNILDSIIADGNNMIENNSFAVMEIVYKAYSGGM